MNNRIKHALFLKGWSFSDGDKVKLKKEARPVLVSEYSSEMKGYIFCPECSANLFRSPESKDFSVSGKSAFFAHSRGIDSDCGLRTKKAEGKLYLTEEDAKKSIKNEELVVLQGFITKRPVSPDLSPDEYDQTAVEDVDGEVTEVPIGRHRGDTFTLPSKVKTVRGICNNFADNYIKYYVMPNHSHAVQLQDLLIDVNAVTADSTSKCNGNAGH
nr:hypothetical protein [uncultured Deefgea sp.]